jgi:hypothetical protein
MVIEGSLLCKATIVSAQSELEVYFNLWLCHKCSATGDFCHIMDPELVLYLCLEEVVPLQFQPSYSCITSRTATYGCIDLTHLFSRVTLER